MKKIILATLFALTMSNAYCENGSQIHKEMINGGYLVAYEFGQGRILQFRFGYNSNIPYSIRYDFYTMEICLGY